MPFPSLLDLYSKVAGFAPSAANITSMTLRNLQPVALARLGVILLVLAALAWATTYGPPGTLTSISLAAMTAFGLVAVGLLSLLTALLMQVLRR